MVLNIDLSIAFVKYMTIKLQGTAAIIPQVILLEGALQHASQKY